MWRASRQTAGAEEKVGSRPISRILSRTVIPLGRLSPVGSSNLPASSAGHAIGRLFGLAPGGVCRAIACCQGRGALLPHHFTLTCGSIRHRCRQRTRHIGGIFLLHFPSARAVQALPGTLPYGVRTFLQHLAAPATVWPTPSRDLSRKPGAVAREFPLSAGIEQKVSTQLASENDCDNFARSVFSKPSAATGA